MKTKAELAKLSKEDLLKELAEEQERSDAIQKKREQEDADREKARKDEDARAARLRADADASRNAEPTEEQWVKLEEEYGMERDKIRSSWKIAQRVAAPLAAELQGYRARDAAAEAVRTAKQGVRESDPQFPKFESLVDEYLNDLPLSEKADPDKLKKHMDRAVHFARGKARATDKTFREADEPIREAGQTQEEIEDAKEHFGEFAISGMPLTIRNDKLVPDDFRKRHAHPDIKGAVRMDEKARWKEAIPVKPR